jgi:hypothetical protein
MHDYLAKKVSVLLLDRARDVVSFGMNIAHLAFGALSMIGS